MRELTRLSNADLDVPSLELGSAEGQGLLQAIDTSKLDVTEALGAVVKLVLNDADVGDLTAIEKVLNITLRSIVGKVSEVGSVRRLGRERKLLANSETTVGGTVLRPLVFDGAQIAKASYRESSCPCHLQRIRRQVSSFHSQSRGLCEMMSDVMLRGWRGERASRGQRTTWNC